MYNAKGEAAGTHPKKEAELFTLASTHLLGHIFWNTTWFTVAFFKICMEFVR